jgi:hypothetical protein
MFACGDARVQNVVLLNVALHVCRNKTKQNKNKNKNKMNEGVQDEHEWNMRAQKLPSRSGT